MMTNERMFKGVLGALSVLLLASAAYAQLRTSPPMPGGDVTVIPGVAGAAQGGSVSTGSKNLLDNGSMAINQRGTGIFTCGTTTVPVTSYSADRWGCNVNVGSGAGRQVYSTSSPPQGFLGYQTIYRTSGALTQPVCSIQEIEGAIAKQAQGQNVVLSFQAKALAGLSADNGNVITAVIVTGTGADEGLGTYTASPAITPAWTGIATQLTQNFTITTSFATYQTTPVPIPAAATEIGVMLCFTPTATGAGVTDGFGFTAVQLEVGNAATAFEQRSIGEEQRRAYRYAWLLTEPAADVCVGAGYSTTTSAARIVVALPVQMRIAPTITFTGTALANTTWKVEDAATPIVLSTPFLATFTANTATNIILTATTGATQTAGRGVLLCGAGGGSILNASADF